jgi:hypothetical protein
LAGGSSISKTEYNFSIAPLLINHLLFSVFLKLFKILGKRGTTLVPSVEAKVNRVQQTDA